MNAVVAKKIRNNFKGWGTSAIDGVVVDGLTLRQTLTRDYRAHLANPKIPFGASYYAKVQEMFREADPAAKQFIPRDPAEVYPRISSLPSGRRSTTTGTSSRF